MIPSKTDPRWKKIVTAAENPNLQSLATKMMLMRVRLLLINDQSSTKMQEAITIAYDFFVKNEAIIANDLKVLFGDK
ncbi:MAG: hypothetical protein A2622_12735 [Bdellovibrionales bacterium RIFCSPHIGHO2_01_FULL_40_29]|nr:MAG: hypothetical protein A2622_12735 [Bdellovibrionales bacterium RIFCSPHIGHO2_01_FULL_40_29]OFZ33439.1 MAG: hypothetical protein A3D17_14150 [Bdellovibrionales bacterium RIFCSPHIGHO2_02_FULL_40_15]